MQAFDLTVRLDYGQFHLSSLPLPDGAGDDLLRLVEEAAHGQGIAVTEGNELVVVISPHQNNFAMPLRVEVWPAEPPSDLDDWQEAFLTGRRLRAWTNPEPTPRLAGEPTSREDA